MSKNKKFIEIFATETIGVSDLNYETKLHPERFEDRDGKLFRKIEDDIIHDGIISVLSQKEELILGILDKKFGKGWTVDQAKDRCEMVLDPWNYETFIVDGVAMLRFHPFKHEMISSINGSKISITQKYEILEVE
jgi:hypothetical protein